MGGEKMEISLEISVKPDFRISGISFIKKKRKEKKRKKEKARIRVDKEERWRTGKRLIDWI
jgi:hypothetical protein